MEKEYDIVIFGATGYTGRYVIEELAKVNVEMKKKWAVAGRNEEKLIDCLEKVQQYLGDEINILQTPRIVADVYDRASIAAMCKKAKLILNCVGPYKLYGEMVVEECIANRAHHVDISGEMKYLTETQAKYFQDAVDNNVYVVQACGFDSIPADYGIALLKEHFKGEMNSAESYVSFDSGPSGRVTNTGTWLSAVYSVKDVFQTKKFMDGLKTVFPQKMPKSHFPLKRRFPISFNDEVKSWCLPFIGPDEGVIKRSQMFGYNYLKQRPAQAKAYLQVDSFFSALVLIFFAAWFGFLSLFSFGQYLLEKFPSFFSAGTFTNEGPTREQVLEGSTKVTLIGEGWIELLADPTDQHVNKPNRKIKMVISGPEPAYALTSMCMVHSGLTILDEFQKMPMTGGVLTPGAAFAKTTLQQRLEKRGVTFVVSA